MSGRNWTRRSIEELVAQYLKNKNTGGEFGCMLSEWHEVNICDSADGSGGSYTTLVGAYDATPETVEGSNYYPIASGSNHNYLMANTGFYSADTGQPHRYSAASGKAIGNNGSYAGTFRTPDGTKIPFTILTFSRKCDIDQLTYVITSGMVNTNNTSSVIVTNDHENERGIVGSNARINRSVYIPYHNGSFIAKDGRNYYNANFIGNAVYTNASGGGTYTRRAGDVVNLVDPTYQPSAFKNVADGKYDFAIVRGRDYGETNAIFDYIDQNYSGSIEYDKTDATKTRNTIAMSIIFLPSTLSLAEVETYAFMLSRWFLDSVSGAGIQDIPQTGSVQYGVDLPHKLTGDTGDIVVRYSRVEVPV